MVKSNCTTFIHLKHTHILLLANPANNQCDLRSLSIIVTMASSGLPVIKVIGSDVDKMDSMKVSSGSSIVSSLIIILAKVLFIPATNVTLYLPI